MIDSVVNLEDLGRVAIAGDWHSDIRWVQTAIPRLNRQAADASTIFHLGDFGLFPEQHGSGFPAAMD